MAEQFAITEATLSAWPSLDEEAPSYGRGSGDAIRLPGMPRPLPPPPQEGSLPAPSASPSPLVAPSLLTLLCLLLRPDPEGLCLQEHLLFCPPAGLAPLCTRESPIPGRPSEANDWGAAKGGLGRVGGEQVGLPGFLGRQRSATSLRYTESSSPSEDEVFYD